MKTLLITIISVLLSCSVWANDYEVKYGCIADDYDTDVLIKYENDQLVLAIITWEDGSESQISDFSFNGKKLTFINNSGKKVVLKQCKVIR